MFVTLPMVFENMAFGTVVGAVFFVLVLFAALTSSISLMETIVSVLIDKTHMKRTPATILMTCIVLLFGIPSCLGYGRGRASPSSACSSSTSLILFRTRFSCPLWRSLTCILIGHVVGTKVIADEVKEGANAFHREKLHRVMIRWVAPVLLLLILGTELATKVFGLFSI